MPDKQLTPIHEDWISESKTPLQNLKDELISSKRIASAEDSRLLDAVIGTIDQILPFEKTWAKGVWEAGAIGYDGYKIMTFDDFYKKHE